MKTFLLEYRWNKFIYKTETDSDLEINSIALEWWKWADLRSRRVQWSLSFFLSFFSSSTWHLHNTSLSSFEEIFRLPFVLGLAGNNACPAVSKVNFLGLVSAFPWCSRMAALWLEPNQVDTRMSEMVEGDATAVANMLPESEQDFPPLGGCWALLLDLWSSVSWLFPSIPKPAAPTSCGFFQAPLPCLLSCQQIPYCLS